MGLNSRSTLSEDIKLSGDINGKVSSTSGDIKIKGNFYGPKVSTLSGYINILGESKGKISSTSGDIKVGKSYGNINTLSGSVKAEGSFKKVNTTSGDVEVGVSSGNINTLSGNVDTEENLGNIKTTSGNVSTSTNNGNIETLSGNIKAGENLGIIQTLVGNINIGEISIKIERNDSNTTTIKGIRGLFSRRSNSIISKGDVNITISSGGTTTTIINGKNVSRNSGNPKTYKVYVNNLCVDYIKREFSVNKQQLSIDQINNNSASSIKIQGENIILHDRGQKIIISKESVEVHSL